MQKVAIIYHANSHEEMSSMADIQKIEKGDTAREQHQKEIHNERATEIRIANMKQTPVFFILGSKTKRSRIIHVEGHGVQADLQNPVILDKDGIEIDTNSKTFDSIKKEYVFLLRTDVANVHNSLNFLEKLGCSLLTNSKQEEKVSTWERYIPQGLKKRNTTTIQLDDFYEDYPPYKSLLQLAREKKVLDETQTSIFLKTESKGSCWIIDLSDPEDFFDKVDLSFEHGSLQQKLIISEVLDIQKDSKKKNLEYRVWVAGGKPSSYSRYVDEKDFLKMPSEIALYASQFCKQMQNVLPPFYILDVALTNKGATVIECNAMTASGRYFHNNFGKFLDDTNTFLQEHNKEKNAEFRFN